MWPFTKKDKTNKEVEKFLKPGMCECGHRRCCHKKGKTKCAVSLSADEEFPLGGTCACQIYIRDDNNDDDSKPQTPSPSELERMLGISR